MEATQSGSDDDRSRRCPGCSSEVDQPRCEQCGAALSAGSWRIERLLAQTGHSRVYLATDEAGRRAALKELHFAQVPGAQQIDAFEREAKTLAGLTHHSVPRFIGSFQEGQGIGLRLYLAFEYVAGQSLAQRLETGPLSEEDAIRIARQVLEILRFLQTRSPAILHRDIKPANIMFREDGGVVLVDFGSARLVEGTHTHRSTLVGTFGYMPPEQLGGTVDRTSDVFSLGATVVHAVTGRAPSELLDPDLSLRLPPGISERLRAWLTRAVSLQRTGRFKDAQEALTALDAPLPAVKLYPPERSWRRRLGLIVATTAAAASVAIAAQTIWASMQPEPEYMLEAESPAIPSADWFKRVRAQCNSLDVRQLMARTPPPKGADGAGQGATCYALAGKFDEAQRLIDALDEGARPRAAWFVFNEAHPRADQGDDIAAGPMMDLVLRYWPENYMALYHAGIAAYWAGRNDQARDRLEDFLRRYQQPDGFTQNAKRALDRIAHGLPADSSIPRGE